MAKIKNLRETPPTKKADLTKESMLLFMKDESIPKDEKKWFVELMTSNKKEKTNNLTHKTVDGYDLAVIREEFAKKYFPELSNAERKNKPIKKAKTFEEKLMDLLEE